MVKVRTSQQKMLIGDYDPETETLCIKERDKLRIITVPREGLEVVTVNGSKPPERTIVLP
jgi:hypothetical protein